jgi:general nucleoside transport system ATP-binding protein
MDQEKTEEIILRVENLSKSFPGVLANDKISLDIRRGEIHCLLGENGAGKSTLAECLYGTYHPDSGKIIFKGEEVRLSSHQDAIKLGIGMVHQHFQLVPPMTVMENIVAGTKHKGIGINIQSATKKVEEICRNYGIELPLNTIISRLPVGQQQWVEILKALYVGAEFLLLDEPTAVLTPQEIERFFSILTRMTRDGLSLILITHKLNEVMDISDRVTVLRKGKLIDTVDTADVTKESLARMMVGREVVFLITNEKIPPGETILEIKDLRVVKDDDRETLRNISLRIRRKEIIGLAGVSGNGQKDLFDVIVGIQKIASGKIMLDGEDVGNSPPWAMMEKGIASIPQDRIGEGLLMEAPIYENLILGNQRSSRFRSGMFFNSKKIKAFSNEKLREFDVAAGSPIQRAETLSGGNLQKVIVAREFSQNPKFLLASQPTRGLDVGAIEYVHQCLLELRNAGAGILLISEELGEIFNLADYIAVIYKGEIMGFFPTEEATVEEVGLLMAGIRGDKQ